MVLHLQCCAIIITVYFKTFPLFQTETLYPINNNSSSTPLASSNQKSMSLWFWHFQIVHVSGIIQIYKSYLSFSVWFSSFNNIFKIHLCCSMYLSMFTHFSGWILFHYMYRPHFVYLFICQCTLKLFPPFGYCKWCCNKQWHTLICLSLCFLVSWIYT